MAKSAVLLVNLGTPEQPTPSAVKRYLSQFLSDKRVVDMPAYLWQPLLHGIILPKRVTNVAQLYQSIWQSEGSPLLTYSRRQQQALATELGEEVCVELAMTYGTPSLSQAIERLLAKNIQQLTVLPLFPQYSSTTTLAVWDAFNAVFRHRRQFIDLHFIRDYAEHPLYIAALAGSIERSFAEHGQPERLIFSYHGIPRRYVNEGDDYPERCAATTQAVVECLGLTPDQYVMTYQSRFGKEPWLTPYTDEVLQTLPAQGVKQVHIICPGFAADCLETLEEIKQTNQQQFYRAGGQCYHYIPALNDQPEHIALLKVLVTA